MPDAPFRIAVTGDTGWDIYTEYVKGFMSDDRRVLKPEVAYDLYVASGAAFTTLALRELLGSDPECGIETQHLVPFEGLEDPWDGHVFSTLIKLLVELKQFADRRSPEARVLRVARVRPLLDEAKVAGPEVFYHLVQAPPVYGQRHLAPEPGTIKLLIIHDGAGKWRNYPVQPPNPPPATRADAPDAIEGMKLVETVLASEAGPTPRIIVSLDHDLPPVQNRHGKLAFDGSQFWDVLAKRKESVCVICSVDILRREGAAISRRLSWEQTVEDLAGDLVWFDKLKALAQFKHLVIPIGQAAALHVMNEGSQRSVDLIFAPLARTGIYRDAVEDGEIVGRNAFMIASLARLFASCEPTAHR